MPQAETLLNPDADARKILDRKIADLEGQIRELKSKRNNLSAICRLPTELLCKVFRECRNGCPQRASGKTGVSWIATTHVCKLWRTVAIGDERLWSALCSTIPLPLLRLMAERCAWMPTSLSYAVPWGTKRSSLIKSIGLIEQVLPQSSRLEELMIGWICGGTAIGNEVKTLTSRAPVLRFLQIVHAWGSPAVHLPKNLFDGHCPSLQTLHLENCLIPWSCDIFRNVKDVLIWADPEDGSAARTPPEEFAATIVQMKHVQDLTLLNSFPDTSTLSISSQFPMAKLAALQSINLGASGCACAAALKRMHLPVLSQLMLECTDLDENSLSSLGFAAAPLWQSLLRPTSSSDESRHFVNALRLDKRESELTIYATFRNEAGTPHNWLGRNLEVKLTRQAGSLGSDFAKTAISQLQFPSLQQLEILELELPTATISDLHYLFSQAPSTRRVYVLADCFQMFAMAVLQGLPPPASSRPALPKLEELEIEDLNLNGEGAMDLVEFLGEFLKARSEGGVGVHQLKLSYLQCQDVTLQRLLEDSVLPHVKALVR
ncbi:hypothetical protein BKA70DRAFT_1292756 [Coprinopsis sp. MPI-PUGE-AT-0042]|nr:hypothetical protein BKA70DRAFT_1292756 [Coprinopsis sp. MPI-PUGE-AT-0042]